MKKILCALMVMCLLVGCMRLTDQNGNPVSVTTSDDGEMAAVVRVPMQSENTTDKLSAMVKGSIYGTGEQVSVFGTCLNVSDGGFPGSFATMSSWYPNGTIFFQNVSMTELQTGYFLFTGPMSAVQGTYLTEMQCHLNDSDEVAKAFGEWQNPLWVRQINDLNGSLQNLSDQITNLSSFVNESFNITFSKIDQLNVTLNASLGNLTQQLLYVAMVANGSVDRNDSYLAHLLQLIAATVGTPINKSLSLQESTDTPVFNKMWTIQETVRNEYNVTVGQPLVSCFISTNNNPNSVNVSMDFLGNGVFKHQEKVLVSGDFSWTVFCAYN